MFPKPREVYEHFLFFGPNLLVSEGIQWKKYRKIIGPSFNEVGVVCCLKGSQHLHSEQRNNRLVWKETIRLMQELLEEKWGDDPVVRIKDSKEITLSVSAVRC